MNIAPKKLNRFHDDLKFADSLSAELDAYYLERFPGAVRVEHVTDLGMQRRGVDKIVHLRDGRTVKIEEKIRRKSWPDFLLEIRSRGTKLGWLFTCKADYICYVYLESREAYFLPVVLLQMAWMENGADWERRYGIKEAQNVTLGGYTSKNIPVPRERLMQDIFKAMTGVLPVSNSKNTKGANAK